MTTPESIAQQVKEQGFAHVKELRSFKHYIELCQGLGSVLQIAVLRIVEDGDYAVQPKPVVFHTDNPQIDIMGWFCASQDKEGGANQLVDMGDLKDQLNGDEFALLQSVLVDAPDIKERGQVMNRVPVITETNSGEQRIYYTPWLLRGDYKKEQREVLNKVAKVVAKKEQESLIERRLEPGQCLFIDNRRMLHGRKTLNLGSDRCLLRCWISQEVKFPVPNVVNIENFPRDNPLCEGFGRHWFEA